LYPTIVLQALSDVLAATSCAVNKFRYDSSRLQLRLSSRLTHCERFFIQWHFRSPPHSGVLKQEWRSSEDRSDFLCELGFERTGRISFAQAVTLSHRRALLGKLNTEPRLRKFKPFWYRRPRWGNPVFQQHASDSPTVEPVADLGSLKVHCQLLVTTARIYDKGDMGIPALRGIDRHSRMRNVLDCEPWLTGDELLRVRHGFRTFGTGSWARVWNRSRPERDLHVSRRRLPSGLSNYRQRRGIQDADE
jgi:hypothetical protein